MKPILKSANQKDRPKHKYRKSELFFDVKPYTQTIIFSDKKTENNFDNNNPFKKKNDELENLDRNEVHNLEKWIDYNKHKKISNMFEEVKMKQLEKEKKLKEMSEKSIKASYYRMPEVRPNILNTILDQEKHICVETQMNPQANKPKYLKSFETIKTEANKMIVNDLIYRKVSAKMRNSSENNEKQKSKENETPIDNELTNNTINNFKHLQQLFLTYKQSQIINYPEIMARIQQSNQQIDKLFDYSNEIKRIKDNSKRNLVYEAEILEEFDAIKQKIEEKKNAQQKIRMMNASNNSKLKMQNETNERILYRLQNNFDSLVNKAQKNLPIAKNKKEEVQNVGFSIEEYMQIQKLNEEKEKTVKMIKAEIDKIKNETKSNNMKLETLEKELQDLRQKKLHYQLELKEIYLIRLKEELKQEDNDSITWIIKAFWRIDNEFNNENFPSELDSDNIAYLTRMAHLEQELADLKQKQRYEILNLNYKKKHAGPLSKEYNDHVTEIKKKFKFMKKERFQIKKTATNKVQYRSAIERKLEEEMLEDYFKKCLGDLDINDFEPRDKQDEQSRKNYELQIKNTIDLIDKTKTQELKRLFNKFKNLIQTDSEYKRFANIIRIVFGAKKKTEILIEFEKFKEELRNKDSASNNLQSSRPKTSKTEPTRIGTAKTTKSNGVITRTEEQKEEVAKDYEMFFSKITLDNQAVNYRYNINYNYTPKIQNIEDSNCMFYTRSRVQTAKTNKIIHF